MADDREVEKQLAVHFINSCRQKDFGEYAQKLEAEFTAEDQKNILRKVSRSRREMLIMKMSDSQRNQLLRLYRKRPHNSGNSNSSSSSSSKSSNAAANQQAQTTSEAKGSGSDNLMNTEKRRRVVHAHRAWFGRSDSRSFNTEFIKRRAADLSNKHCHSSILQDVGRLMHATGDMNPEIESAELLVEDVRNFVRQLSLISDAAPTTADAGSKAENLVNKSILRSLKKAYPRYSMKTQRGQDVVMSKGSMLKKWAYRIPELKELNLGKLYRLRRKIKIREQLEDYKRMEDDASKLDLWESCCRTKLEENVKLLAWLGVKVADGNNSTKKGGVQGTIIEWQRMMGVICSERISCVIEVALELRAVHDKIDPYLLKTPPLGSTDIRRSIDRLQELDIGHAVLGRIPDE